MKLQAAAAVFAAALAFVASAAGPEPWAWSLVETKGSLPAARQGHAAVEVGRKVYVIGGCVQEIRCFNDVHVFDTGSHTWTEEKISGDAPEPRGGHTATLLGAEIFIIGGANSEETFGDVHRLDLETRQWIRADLGEGPKPAKRTSHATAADASGRLYVYGGYDADGNFLDDIWSLKVSGDEVQWARAVPTGEVPQAREGHSLTLVDQKLVLFGGYTADGKDVNDVHVYDPSSQRWSELELAGNAPQPRQAHSAARHGHEVIVAGGCDVSGARPECFNDVWSLSLIDLRWKQRSAAGNAWKPREGHSSSFVGGRLFSFGGCELGSNCFGDVAVLDTLDPCPSGCGDHGVCVDGLYCKCTKPGFTGHDCMEPMSCKMDCGLHGACGQDGQCACGEGWAGKTCTEPPRCPGHPLPCSGRGECLPGGKCQCQSGAAGSDCYGDAVLENKTKALATVASAANISNHTDGAKHNKTSKRLGLLEVNYSKKAPAPPAPVHTEDFGMTVNSDGHVHKNAADCEDNCNWRGICEAGVCYCQPGFNGVLCEDAKVDRDTTLSMLLTVAIGGIALFGTTGITLMLLSIQKRKKRDQEGPGTDDSLAVPGV